MRSRGGSDAVPEWRRVPPSAVAEIGYSLLDLSVVRMAQYKSEFAARLSVTYVRNGCAQTTAGAKMAGFPPQRRCRIGVHRSLNCNRRG
jgi:hypothetical protein